MMQVLHAVAVLIFKTICHLKEKETSCHAWAMQVCISDLYWPKATKINKLYHNYEQWLNINLDSKAKIQFSFININLLQIKETNFKGLQHQN